MINRNRHQLLAACALAFLAGLAGFFAARHLPVAQTHVQIPERQARPVYRSSVEAFPHRDALKPVAKREPVKPTAAARSNEMLVRIRDAAAMRAFLDQAIALGGRVIGSIPGLNAVRIAFDDTQQGEKIRSLLPESATAGFNYIISLPRPAPKPDSQDAGGPYVGFGNQALAWLGVPESNASWGSGVKVAMLDTGLMEVPGLALQSISQIDLVGQNVGATDSQYHGTAVASILTSTSTEEPGMAPSAQLTSIRVLDGDGASDTFTVARAIMDAVSGGAQVISMSLGSYGDDFVLRDAVDYAIARNVAVVAAVGNDGINSVAYPAAYPGVIAVTAVDANGQRGGFANFGPQVSIAAPGIGVYTPLSSEKVINISGTSAAVPFVAGAVAGLLSQNPGMSAKEAANLLMQYANDAGAPGPDNMYGAGIMSIDRILNRNQPGINDAAVADFYYAPGGSANGPSGVTVTAQNRGTTILPDVKLEVGTSRQSTVFDLGAMGVGAVKTQQFQIDPAQSQSPDGVALKARVFIDGALDSKPANDVKSVVLKPAGSGSQ